VVQTMNKLIAILMVLTASVPALACDVHEQAQVQIAVEQRAEKRQAKKDWNAYLNQRWAACNQALPIIKNEHDYSPGFAQAAKNAAKTWRCYEKLE